MLASYVPTEPGNAGMPNDIEPRKDYPCVICIKWKFEFNQY